MSNQTIKTTNLDLLKKVAEKDMQGVNHKILDLTKSHAELVPLVSQHLLSLGGKRIRPMLTIACANLCGGGEGAAVTHATCIELIHTATLLHDDVVDESELRRGNQTANSIWGNKASVLVGDYLLSRTFRLTVEYGCKDLMDVLSEASVVIVEGEVMQLATTKNLETNVDDYMSVIGAKTAELFKAATELGAIAANKPELRGQMRDFGYNLGIAFQIVDDVLDYSANQEELGKVVGDDFREGKVTLPVILAYASASDDSERRFWKRTMELHEQNEDDLKTAIYLVDSSGALKHSIDVAKKHAEIALKSLSAFPESEELKSLQDAVAFCLMRVS